MISTEDEASAPARGLVFAMTHAPMRLLVSSLLLVFGAVGVARADSGTMPDGSSIVFKRLFIHENNSQDPVLPAHDPTSTQQYFNFAHCVCSERAGSSSPAA